MAKGWLRALQSASDLSREVEIVGLVDLDPAMAKALAAEFALDDVIIGTDLASVIEATRANMVFDVVVPSARFHVVSTALKLGCHVLSEKPLATSMDEAKSLLALAAETGRVHAVVQNRRFISGVRRLRRAIEDGLIGDVSGIHCDFFLAPHFGGFREEMDNVLLLDMAIHTFDAARFVSGKQPLSVYCVESNPLGSWYAHGASANAIFKLSGGAVFTYRGSWCAEGRRTSWESAWRLIGSKGMITWDGEEAFEATVAGNEPGLLRGHQERAVPLAPDEDETHGHRSVLADFIDAVKSGRKPETVSDDNIKSLSMVLGAIESARTGLPVSISVEGH
jgi:predicted dehydrogenase